MLAEKTAASGEKDFPVKRKKEVLEQSRPLLIALSFLLLAILYIAVYNTTALFAALLLTKLAGSVVTGLLLWFEVDKSNPILKQFCTSGRDTDCSAVLGSKAAKLFNWLSWSEVGFFYFAGGFLFMLLSGAAAMQSFAVLTWLNLLALPYTLFSVLYQWKVVRQWCPLCLLIQGLLIVEFFIGYFGFWQATTSLPNISQGLLLPLLTGYMLPALFWMATKNIYLKAHKTDVYRKETVKFKYNKDIFNALLSQQKKITKEPEGLGITIGNPLARHSIIKVCNPYCGPCGRAHTVLEEIVKDNDDVRLQIIFTATDKEEDERRIPVLHFMTLAEQGDKELLERALEDWYGGNKNYEQFKSRYPVHDNLEKQGSKLEAMSLWCEETGISFTPTIFINGCQLPQVYRVEDLKYLL